MLASALFGIDAIAQPRYFVLGIPESLESQESFVLEFTGEQIDLARAIIGFFGDLNGPSREGVKYATRLRTRGGERLMMGRALWLFD